MKKKKAEKPAKSPLVVHQMKLGPMDNFVYIIGNRHRGICAVIDPAWNVPAILANSIMLGLRITKILFTHNHNDHSNGLSELIKSLYMAETEICMLEEEAVFTGFNHKHFVPLLDQEIIQLGNGLDIKTFHTPGHTPGAACYHINGHLFTGDTLFVNDCGRTDLKGSSPEAMKQSLQKILATFPGSTIIYPGHDYGPTKTATLSQQKKTNPCLLECLK